MTTRAKQRKAKKIDKTLLFDGGSIGELFLLVKGYFDRGILTAKFITGKVNLNPTPKIEFHRYCKGLYANFMHPLVKKKIL